MVKVEEYILPDILKLKEVGEEGTPKFK